MFHESVHSQGEKLDTEFGSSKNLSRILIDSCAPVLGSRLGGLYQ